MVTKEESLERLQNLHRVLKGIRTHPDIMIFDLGVFVSEYSAWRKFSDTAVILKNAVDESCGTVCCLLGAAGLDPWFRERGLKVVDGRAIKLGGNKLWIDGRLDSLSSARIWFGLDDPECDDRIWYSADDESITVEEYLFAPCGYLRETEIAPNGITPEMVMEHLREVVEHYHGIDISTWDDAS